MKHTLFLLVLILSRSVCEDSSEADSEESDESDSSDSNCEQPVDLGHCSEESEDTTRYAYMTENDECVEFTYKGCKGNSNNFETLTDCEEACLNSSSDSENDETISI